MKAYYDARAPEYDDWYYGRRGFAYERPGWEDELDALGEALRALPPAGTLDVACGTGFLTQHLPGEVVGLDQSAAMLDEARKRLPQARFVQADALERLPFGDGAFDRLFTGHFYGHLEHADSRRFLVEARRVARELVVVDASRRQAAVDEEWQERILGDGSRWEVFKRYFTGAGLASELGGGRVLHEGRWFVAVAS